MNTDTRHKPSLKADARDDGLAQGLKRLFAHISRRRRIQGGLLLGLLLVGALAELMTIGAVLPFLTVMVNPDRASNMPVLSAFFQGAGWSSHDLMVPITLLFIIMAALSSAIRILLSWASQKYLYRLGHDISVGVFRNFLYQSYFYHTSRNSSEILSQISKINIIILSMINATIQIITSLILILFVFSALLFINTIIALTLMVGFGGIYIVLSLVTRKVLQSGGKTISETLTQRIKITQEGIGGIRDVIINRSQDIYIDTFTKLDLRERDAYAQNGFIGAAPRIIIEGVGMILIALVALFLSQGSGGWETALPVLGALALGAARLLPLLQLVYFSWSQINGHRGALNEVLEFLDLPLPKAAQGGVVTSPLPFNTAITFNGVSFRYRLDRPNVLNVINLTLPRGARIGIIGQTGSGKSTFVDLLMGLLPPSSGAIRIDGEALTVENTTQWQQRVAHVPQAIYLADASIAENIAFGLNSMQIDRERLVRAARQAAIADFVESLPEGYDTFVGERGTRLSGGQRQRIGIARALYREADVLVLDEATSALDTETETAVMDAVSLLGRNLTIFIIAHRLSTLKDCDLLIRLNAGHVEMVTHHSLSDPVMVTSGSTNSQ